MMVNRLGVDRTVLLGIFGFSVLALGVALLTQHQMGMMPCPWCILQRMIFLAIAAAALAGMRWKAFGFTSILLLSAGGIAAALWQYNVASESLSCALTFADRVIVSSRLDVLLPGVFEPKAGCADAKADLLGIPYEFFSMGLFASFLGDSLWRLSSRIRSMLPSA